MQICVLGCGSKESTEEVMYHSRYPAVELSSSHCVLFFMTVDKYPREAVQRRIYLFRFQSMISWIHCSWSETWQSIMAVTAHPLEARKQGDE
jgi:hypothetical protein